MFGYLVGALGIYLFLTGAVPIGKAPFLFEATTSVSAIFTRTAGAMILLGIFIPSSYLSGWYGKPILFGGALLVLFIGMIASLSGRAR
jgi:hypothetical protein